MTLDEIQGKLACRGVRVGLTTIHGWSTHICPKRAQFKALVRVLKVKPEALVKP